MSAECSRSRPPFWWNGFQCHRLGDDSKGGEVSVEVCTACGTPWLEYLIEEPHYSRSGRWWRAPLADAEFEGLEADSARPLLESREWCFVGGSFHDSTGHRIEAPVRVS